MPNSLVSTTLRCKYFSSSSVLEAKVGSRPLFLWHSIVSSILLVKTGMFWNIGNGCHIKIWVDKWVPRPTSYKIQSPVHILHRNAYVKELIDCQSLSWNTNLISQIFTLEEACLICSIPLSKYALKEKITWKPTKHGQFTLISTCHLEMNLVRDKIGASSQENNEDFYSNVIWSVNILGLVKHFI